MKYNWNVLKYDGITNNLGKQLEKIIRSGNRNKYTTRKRYKDAQERFIIYLAKKFHMQKLYNIQDKHLRSYVEELRRKGNADTYIKTELSAIRALQRDVPGKIHLLTDAVVFNNTMGLSVIKPRRIDRAWSRKEIEQFLKLVKDRNKEDYGEVVKFILLTGCSLDETVNLRVHEATRAVKKQILTVVNGTKKREVILYRAASEVLNKKLANCSDHGVFLYDGIEKKSDIIKYKNRLKKYISDNSKKFQETSTNKDCKKLSIQGLRMNYAIRFYKEQIENEVYKASAIKNVLIAINSEKGSAIDIYLESL
jgi:site-specific recombinase XerC